MKKTFYAIVIIATLLTCAYAQYPTQYPNKKVPGSTFSMARASVSLLGGYVLRDKVTFPNAYGYVDASAQYGVMFEYFVRPLHAVSLSYNRIDTHIPLYLYSGLGGQLNEGSDAVSINYILLGGTTYAPIASPIVKPYGGLGLGVAIISGKDGGNTYTKFAWDAKLGIKLRVATTVAIKLQAQLQSIAQGVGGGLYLGTGGTGLGVSTYSSVYQFGFGGGLVFDLK